MSGPRTSQVIEQTEEQHQPTGTPVARGQPQDPEEGNWGDEMDTDELSDAEVEAIMRGD